MKMLRNALLALMAAGMVATAQAQTWPDKPIRLIIPYAPGGGADGAARLIATQLGKALGQTVFVDSRAGGNTTIAGIAVARAPADGYTLLMTGGSTMSVLPLMTEIWFGLYAPAKTPASVVMRINDEMRKWLATAKAREAFAAIGHEPAPSTPDEVRQRIAAEQKLFGPAIKSANIKAE